MRSVTLNTCLSEPTTKIWMKIDPYCQRQKCSRASAVSSEIKFLRIFAGVRWREGFKWEWGGRKWRFFAYFTRYILRTFTPIRPQLLYNAIIYKTRWAGQSPTWGRPSPQVRVGSQCSYSKFLSQQWQLASNSSKKAVLSQRWPRNAPKNFRFFGTLALTTPMATFPELFHGLLFVLFQSTLWICVQNLKSVAFSLPQITGVSKNWAAHATP